jgi:tRNA (guanine-N7-)-methyltransferase
MTHRTHPDGTPWRNFYGRIRGKTLNAAQVVRLETDLADLSPGPVSREDNPDRRPLDLAARFGDRPIWLEIGFGGGEHMVHMAKTWPDMSIIGAEPFVNGVAMLLGKIESAGVSNLAIYPGDVRDLFDVLPEASISKAFLNYPDPWPKSRHHRRRFVTPGYLAGLRRVLAPGAEFRVATDIPDYVRQTMEEVPKAGFTVEAGPTDQPWTDWISTRYEQKALREGRRPHYMTFRQP